MLLEHIIFFRLKENTSLTENMEAYVDRQLGEDFWESLCYSYIFKFQLSRNSKQVKFKPQSILISLEFSIR